MIAGISATWLKTVLACIPSLPKDEIKKRILTIAISKGQLSQTIVSRQASCHLLGEIAPRFDTLWYIYLYCVRLQLFRLISKNFKTALCRKI